MLGPLSYRHKIGLIALIHAVRLFYLLPVSRLASGLVNYVNIGHVLIAKRASMVKKSAQKIQTFKACLRLSQRMGGGGAFNVR